MKVSASPLEPPAPSCVNLASFCNAFYDPGRGRLVRTLWYFVSLLFFESGWFPWSAAKRRLLRCFGARVGRGVVIKPQVRIKYPWRLTVDDHAWIGQEVWIDNLIDVAIGSHVCVSQRAYFCTGSHDHRRSTFDLITRPITIEPGAWVGAGAILLGGVTVEANAIAAAGSVVVEDVPAGTIVAGVPARVVRKRRAEKQEIA